MHSSAHGENKDHGEKTISFKTKTPTSKKNNNVNNNKHQEKKDMDKGHARSRAAFL